MSYLPKLNLLLFLCFRGFQLLLDFSKFLIYSLDNKVNPQPPSLPVAMGQCPKYIHTQQPRDFLVQCAHVIHEVVQHKIEPNPMQVYH